MMMIAWYLVVPPLCASLGFWASGVQDWDADGAHVCSGRRLSVRATSSSTHIFEFNLLAN